MNRIHVCPLSQVEATILSAKPTHVVSLLALRHRVPTFSTIAPQNRLHLALSDIVTETPSYVLAEAAHVSRLITFVEDWDRSGDLLIHCYAGVSRSTAAAFVALCTLDKATSEADHARRLRAASPSATPNPRLIALADAALDRDGRMIEAVAALGRGAECFEGNVFSLDLPQPVETDARRVHMG